MLGFGRSRGHRFDGKEYLFLSELVADHTRPILERLAECEEALKKYGGSSNEYFRRWRALRTTPNPGANAK